MKSTVFEVFEDIKFKISGYKQTSILVLAFWNFKLKVLKYQWNFRPHTTVISKLVKPLKYMPTDKLYDIFFMEVDLDWLELAKKWVRFQKIDGFKNEHNQKVLVKVVSLILYSSMKKD